MDIFILDPFKQQHFGVSCTESLQQCPTLCNPVNCNTSICPSVHGILQAGILEQIVIPFSRGSSQPRNQTLVPRVLWLLHCRQSQVLLSQIDLDIFSVPYSQCHTYLFPPIQNLHCFLSLFQIIAPSCPNQESMCTPILHFLHFLCTDIKFD